LIVTTPAQFEPRPFKIPESVLVVVHTPTLDVLLLKRADHAAFWQSVTGSRDTLMEPLLHTAQRELHEETGLTGDPASWRNWNISNTYEIYPEWQYRYAPGVTLNTEHVFSVCVASCSAVTLSVREHTAYQWLPYRAAADACFSPSNAEAILLLPRFCPDGVIDRQG
jgi:dihydroneopterin triphosphate diphosphatase